MSYDRRIQELGIALPDLPKPLGAYVPCVRTGNLLFLSGMLPLVQGRLQSTGRVGEKVTLDEAREACRISAINALAVVRSAVGSLDRVSRCVKLTGFVASAPDFTDQPKVLNAASELMAEIFGDSGRHARAAVGVSVLPLDSPVEIEFLFELHD